MSGSAPAVSGSGWYVYAKNAAFGIFHSMTEKTGHQRVTTRSQAFKVMLLLIDTMQVCFLALRPEYGWSEDSLSWIKTISILDLVLPQRDPALFNLVYICVVMVVWFAICDASYVGYMFQQNRFTHLWPLHALRFIVGILVTAAFVPVYGIVISPWDCVAMKSFNGEDFDCNSFHGAGFRIISTITLLCFVPFGLASALVFHESDSNSKVAVAKCNGRESMYGVLAKVVAATCARLVNVWPAVSAIAVVVPYACIGIFVAFSLPFYNPAMNAYRVAAASLQVWVAIGALLLVTLGEWMNTGTFSFVWLLAAVPVCLAGSRLPKLRYWMIQNKLAEIHVVMDKELSDRNLAQPSTMMLQRSSRRLLQAESDRSSGSSASAASAASTSASTSLFGIVALARRIRSRKHHHRVHDMEPSSVSAADQERYGILKPGVAQSTVLIGVHAFEIELLVRAELARPGSKVQKTRKFDVPTVACIERCMWIFAEAIEHFQSDPADLALVKIEYARFLQTYTSDTALTSAALEAAKLEQPSLEGEFEVFTRMRRIQQKQQSATLGKAGMGLIELVAFTKYMDSAITSHLQCLATQLVVVKTLARALKHDGKGIDMATSQKLGEQIEEYTKHSSQAGQYYKQLMRNHADAPNVATLYSVYCLNVQNDPALAAEYADDDVAVLMRASAVNADDKTLQPVSRTNQVMHLVQQFRWGFLLLLLATSAVFVVTGSTLSSLHNEIYLMHEASVLRTQAVDITASARSLQLGLGQENPLLGTTAATVTQLASDFSVEFERVMEGAAHIPALRQHTTAPALDVVSITSSQSKYTAAWSLQDVGMMLASDLLQCLYTAQSNGSVTDSTSFHFIADNSVKQLLPQADTLVSLMEDTAQDHFTAVVLLVAMVGTVLAISMTLSCWVTRNGLKRATAIKEGLLDIALCLAPRDLRLMKLQYILSHRFITRLRREKAKASNSAAPGVDELDDLELRLHGLRAEDFMMNSDDDSDYSDDDSGHDSDGSDPGRAILRHDVEEGRSRDPLLVATESLLRLRPARAGFKPAFSPVSEGRVKGGSGAEEGEDGDEETKAGVPGDSKAAGEAADAKAAIDIVMVAQGGASGPPLGAAVVASRGDSEGEGEGEGAGQGEDKPLAPPRPAMNLPPLSVRTAKSPLPLPPPASSTAPGDASPGARPAFTTPTRMEAIGMEAMTAGLGSTRSPSPMRRRRGSKSGASELRMSSHLINSPLQEVVTRVRRQSLLTPMAKVPTNEARQKTVKEFMKWMGVAVAHTKLKRKIRKRAGRGHPDRPFLDLWSSDTNAADDHHMAQARIKEEVEARNRRTLWKITAALMLVVALTGVIAGLGVQSISEVSSRSSELNQSSRLAFLTSELAHVARELVIGDEVMLDHGTAVSTGEGLLTLLSKVRRGLRFGDEELNLGGSVGRSEEQDTLLFGGTIDGVVVNGLDSQLSQLEREVGQVLTAYASQSAYASADPDIRARLLASPISTSFGDVVGSLREGLLLSSNLYEAEADDMVSASQTADLVFACATAALLLALYVGVFRRMTDLLLAQAEHTNQMLRMLPASVVRKRKALRKFFNAAAGDTGSVNQSSAGSMQSFGSDDEGSSS